MGGGSERIRARNTERMKTQSQRAGDEESGADGGEAVCVCRARVRSALHSRHKVLSGNIGRRRGAIRCAGAAG